MSRPELYVSRGYQWPISSRRAYRRKVEEHGEDSFTEIKRASYAQSTLTDITTAGQVTSMLGLIAQGAKREERIGDRIYVRNVNFRYHLSSIITNQIDYVRVMVFYGDGPIPTATDLVNGGFIASTYGQMTPYRLDDINIAGFTMNCLFDKTFPMVPGGANTTEGARPAFHFNMRFPIFQSTEYTTNTTADPQKGWILIYHVSSNANANTTQYQRQTDIYFNDME